MATGRKGFYMKNEELIVLIQDKNTKEADKEEYLTILYKQTENAIYSLYHKYKDNPVIENDDLKAILNLGWTKAVLKYDIDRDKTKSSFVNFAMLLMKQEYIITAKKIKCSQCSLIDNRYSTAIATADAFIDDVAITNEVDRVMEKLKRRNYMTYLMVKEYFYNNKTQEEIAEEFNISQSSVWRKIEQGKDYIKQLIK